MHNVEIRVKLIAKSSPIDGNVLSWLNEIGAYHFGHENYYDSVEGKITPGEELVRLAGKRCYMSYEVGLNPNISRVRDDMTEFIDNILKVGHGSVLEHAHYTFSIEGVSRVFTGEMNRHRHFNVSEGSMRYIRFDDIPFWIPTSLRPVEEDSQELIVKKSDSIAIFCDLFTKAEEAYKQLIEIWKDELTPESKFKNKKAITSMMRRIIPMGVATGGIWTGNLRGLRHLFEMRCSEHAEEEILLVASKMLEIMIKEEPNFFKDFEKVDGFWKPRYHKV